MRKTKQNYTHIASSLMLCSALLGAIVPTTNAMADNKPQARTPNKVVVQGSMSSKASLNKVAGFSSTMSSGLAPSNTSSVPPMNSQNSASKASSFTNVNLLSARQTSASSAHPKASSAVSKTKNNADNNRAASKKDNAPTGQITVNYQYNHEIVGQRTYNLRVGESLNTSEMPQTLRNHYLVTDANNVKLNAAHNITDTVSLARKQTRQAQKKVRQSSVERAMANYKQQKVTRKIDKKFYTPLPSAKYNRDRKAVVNPMLRPNNAPRLTSSKQFKQHVPMTATTTPRDLNAVEPYKDFSPSVLRYKPYMDKVCSYYHMTQYETLMLAIMQCESGGRGSDVMQSSESLGLSPNSLSASKSIEQGVRYMSSIVKKAKKMDKAEQHDKQIPKRDYHYYANDTRLLAQTYNYGGNFMDYVAKQKGGFTMKVAQRYSRDVVAPRLGNTNGSTYQYDNPISRMYHQTFLYTNGGNYYYGDLVQRYAVGGYMRPVLDHLVKYSGKKYAFGGSNPSEDTDSASLVSRGLRTVHVKMPKNVKTQWKRTRNVKGGLNNAKAGDLVFFHGTYGGPKNVSHVGFVLDRHTMFTADSQGVGFHSLDTHYWQKHLAGVHRLHNAGALNTKANNQLNKEAAEINHGKVPSGVYGNDGVMRLGKLSGTNSSTSAGDHFTPNNVPNGLKKYIHKPEAVHMTYGSSHGWSDPGDQCVNFANSFFRAIWNQKRNFVFGNGIDMADKWGDVMKGNVSTTPHAGAIASTNNTALTGGNSAGHTFVVEHVFKDGKILVAEENWPGESGSDASATNTWDYALLPQSIVDNGTEFFMPSKKSNHLNWK